MASQGQTYTRCTHLWEVWFIVVCIVLNENFPECVNSVLFFFFFPFYGTHDPWAFPGCGVL